MHVCEQLNAVDVDAEGLTNNAGVFRVETGEGASEEVCDWSLLFFSFVLCSAAFHITALRSIHHFITHRPSDASHYSRVMQFDVHCLNADLP